MQGKTALVTGGTTGIGFVTARVLAEKGAAVTIVGRSPQRGEQAARAIRAEVPGAEVRFERADLSLLDESRRLARNIAESTERLDVLVNNAGAIFSRRQVTADGLEATFALNHMSYFLLTNLLLNRLRAAEAGRIVVVASIAHRRARLDFDDLQCERRYSVRTAYSRSKLANVMFAYALARRLEDSPVTVNALHPGLVASRFGSNNGWLFRNGLKLAFRVSGAIGVEEGAELNIRLASDPALEGVSGRYFSDGEEVPSSPASLSVEDQERLWAASEAIAAR
ncbi:MAG: SDR family oxidoreductase [Alphaproteobacteria bacterium]|nr:SDR family oxidoreductase [Alphaproteobacteria bacterium]